MDQSSLVTALRKGEIAVIPTDTLYGIVASALDPQAVEKVYLLRRRNPAKPCIVLISEFSDLATLGIEVNSDQKKILDEVWPGPVSIILPTKLDVSYLHRGTNTLAIRLPNDENLRVLIRQTGPLIAPSANYEGQSPASTIVEAKAYFGDEVIYVDGEIKKGQPSGLIDLTQNPPVSIRPLLR